MSYRKEKIEEELENQEKLDSLDSLVIEDDEEYE